MGILNGKVVVIAGGSRGIGRAAAELCANAGAWLALCGRAENALREAAEIIRKTYAVPVITHVADMLDVAAVERFVDAIGARYGRIDALVNNVGESSQREAHDRYRRLGLPDSIDQVLPKGKFKSISDDEWQCALDPKLLGMVRMTRAALRLMVGAGSSIVNVTGIKGNQRQGVLGPRVSDAILTSLTKRMSLELGGAGIRVNVVSMGHAIPPQAGVVGGNVTSAESLAAFLAPRVGIKPLGRLGAREAVARAIFYLATPLSSCLTGQGLAVDRTGLLAVY